MSEKRHRRVSPTKSQRQWQAFVAQLPAPLQATAQRMRRNRPPCLLCGGAGQVLGIFVPYAPHVWGAPPGQAAGCCYALCRRCDTLPDKRARAEAAIWAQREQARRQLAAPWN
jgi:hypothetical protein